MTHDHTLIWFLAVVVYIFLLTHLILSNQEEDSLAAAYYNKQIHDEDIENNMNFDGKVMLLCKIKSKEKSFPDKHIAAPLRLQLISIIKVLAKVSSYIIR